MKSTIGLWQGSSLNRMFPIALLTALLASSNSIAIALDLDWRVLAYPLEDQFGAAVDLHEGKVLIGAPAPSFPDERVAFIYDLRTGEQLVRLTSNQVSSYDRFGSSVKLTDGYALVGARGGRAAYLFDTQTGQELRRFRHPTSSATFAYDVDMNDEIVVIGDHYHNASGDRSGAVYIFNRASGAFIERLVMTAPAYDTYLGTSLDLVGDRLVISAPGARETVGRGAIYVYDYHAKTSLTLDSTDIIPGSRFGFSVAATEDYVLVGDPGAGNGLAYLFDINSGELLRRILSPPTNNGEFGTQVALHGNYALIGDPSRFELGYGTVGTAFLYDVRTGELLRTMYPGGAPRQDRVGWQLDLEDDLFVFGFPEIGRVFYTSYVPEPNFLATMLSAIGLAAIWHVRRRAAV